VGAVDRALETIQGIKTDNLKAFREELTKARNGAVDLRTQLANIAQTPLEKALSGAASPFDTVLKGAADNVKSLQAAFGKLSNADQQGRNGASLRAQLAEQNRIILATNQGRNQALLSAQQAFDHCKARVKELGLAGPGKVRVNKAGCLDRCAGGPIAVVYPEAVWYSFVDQSDIDEIVESHLKNGQVVERLLTPPNAGR